MSGKHVLILGLAREGVSLARFFAGRGARVTVTDSAPPAQLAGRAGGLADLGVRCALGGDHPELVTMADEFFVSPGVPEGNVVYRAAVERGLPVQSMTTLFFDLCPGTIVGVTGSSGKTTTTGLIGHIVRQAGRDSVVGGNIGDPMLDLLPRIRSTTTVVLELSSFQLSILRRSPHVAVVTNVTPNHLDRHGTMEAYVGAKLHITEHQHPTDWAVVNAADPYAEAFARSTPGEVRWFSLDGAVTDGATAHGGWLGLSRDGTFTRVIAEAGVPLLGRHNQENVLAALCAADILDVPPDVMRAAVQAYRPAPHRLQTVAERHGVRYIDDSIATSPARASVALQALSAPVVLIAGGRDKHLPWDDFARLAVQRARAVFLIGEAAPIIADALDAAMEHGPGLLDRRAIVRCGSLEEAVRLASVTAAPGDVVLLSPGCASYDMFHDFEERGAIFAGAVEGLDAA